MPPPAWARGPWTGFYVGIDGGLDWAKVKNDGFITGNGTFDTDATSDINLAGVHRMHTIGASAGAKVGFNYQMGHWFVGLEGDYNTLTGKHAVNRTFKYTSTILPDAGGQFTLSNSFEQKWISTVRFRGGVALNNSTIAYVTVGSAEAQSTYGAGFSDTVVPVAPVSSKVTKKINGFVLGLGEEFRLGGRMSCFFEILNTTLGSANIVLPVSSTDHYDATGKFNDDVLRFGLNIRLF